MSSLALEHGQSHFRYGPDLPFEEGLFIEMLIHAAGASKAFSSLNNGWYHTTIDIGVFEALAEYVIHVKATDNAANSLFYNYTVKGAFAGVLDFIADMWDGLVGILKAAAEAAGEAVNLLLEWIKEMLTSPIDHILDWIKTQIVTMLLPLCQSWDEFTSTGNINETLIKQSMEGLAKLFAALMAVWVTITALLYIVVGVTAGAGAIAMMAISAAIMFSLSMSDMGRSGTSPLGLSKVFSTSYILEYVVQFLLEKIGDSYDKTASTTPSILQTQEFTNTELTIYFTSVFSVFFSYVSWAFAAAEMDESGTAWAVVAAVLGTAAIVLSWALPLVSSLVYFVVGFSIISIIAGFIATFTSITAVPGIVSGIGIGLSIFSLMLLWGVI